MSTHDAATCEICQASGYASLSCRLCGVGFVVAASEGHSTVNVCVKCKTAPVWRAQAFLDRVKAVLAEKNKAYGNSASDPVRIFSKASRDEQLLVRIDDKLSRIARGNVLDGGDSEDVLMDLVGYIALYVAAMEGGDA